MTLSELIKQEAKSLGFINVGIAKAGELEGFSAQLDKWLQAGYQADMGYMSRNCEKRADVRILVDGAQSVISMVFPYYTEKRQPDNLPQVSMYAYGEDYHLVLKDKMQLLWDFIKVQEPELDGRMFVDSAPVSDKLWAAKAGLGWIGKNACLIHPDYGSFVFICELIVNISLEYDEPFRSHFCGSCTRCIDACPTGAIVQPGIIDSRRCISFLTIENKGEIDASLHTQIGNRAFGCDVCQDVCPWNKRAIGHSEPRFEINEALLHFDEIAWQNLSTEEFNRRFKMSPIKRTKLSGMTRNVTICAANNPCKKLV